MRNNHHDQDDLDQEVNDKLNELWTGSKDKRQQLLRNITPSYSRRTDMSELNVSHPHPHQKQVIQIRQKLAHQVSNSKHKDIEIDNLKKAIAQLSNDKRMLIHELENSQAFHQDQNSSSALNQSSIEVTKQRINEGRTANFSTYKKQHSKPKKQQFTSIKEEPDSNASIHQGLENLSKKRLLELLRSTSEYREFVFYYDSHQLSYLKRLQIQHKKNCSHSVSQREKAFWAPSEILAEFRDLNIKEKLNLDQFQIELILSRMKFYFEKNQEQKIKKQKEHFEEKVKKIQRENQGNIPYDLVEVCKAKQRQLSKQCAKKRANTIKS